jgi:hypothetical protein
MGAQPYQIIPSLCTYFFEPEAIWATRPLDVTPFFFFRANVKKGSNT